LLEERGVDYCVVSETQFGIWQKLADVGDDFDLVSTIDATNYSWWDYKYDFPFYSAMEYFDKLKAEITPSIAAKIIKQRVGRVSEGSDGLFSIMDERGGVIAHSRDLVFATGLAPDPSIIPNLQETMRVKNSKVLVKGFCDSTNAYISRLARNGNTIFLACAHMNALDKIDTDYGGKNDGRLVPLPYDQYEPFAMFVNHLPLSYFSGCWIAQLPFDSSLKYKGLYMPSRFHNLILRLWRALHSYKKVPGLERFDGQKDNLEIATKYWPSDVYQKYYSRAEYRKHMLEHNIFFNDVYWFIKEGIVKLVRYEDVAESNGNVYVTCEGERHEIEHQYGSKRVNFKESILFSPLGERLDYKYNDHLFGIWNPAVPNVYHLGTTRPITGAFGQSAELQGMFVTRMITDAPFKERMQRDGASMAAVNASTQNLSMCTMYSGQLCEMIGQQIGSRLSWRDVFSMWYNPIYAANVYFYGPCNALRYRVSGTFAVESAKAKYKEMCEGLGVEWRFVGSLFFDFVGIQCMLSNFLLSTTAAFFKPTFPMSLGMAVICFGAPQRAVAETVRTVCQPTLSLVTAFSDAVDPFMFPYTLMLGGTLYSNLKSIYSGGLNITTPREWLSANLVVPSMVMVLVRIGFEYCNRHPVRNIFNDQCLQHLVTLDWFKNIYVKSQTK
jgi:hypothetical protein